MGRSRPPPRGVTKHLHQGGESFLFDPPHLFSGQGPTVWRFGSQHPNSLVLEAKTHQPLRLNERELLWVSERELSGQGLVRQSRDQRASVGVCGGVEFNSRRIH